MADHLDFLVFQYFTAGRLYSTNFLNNLENMDLRLLANFKNNIGYQTSSILHLEIVLV